MKQILYAYPILLTSCGIFIHAFGLFGVEYGSGPIWGHLIMLSVDIAVIDGNEIDEKEFWDHYTRSQRLDDHLRVIKYLEEHPPEGWNGKLIFIGVSEGGPLVTDLSILCPNTLATVNWVGAGDSSWADELWQFFECWKQDSC